MSEENEAKAEEIYERMEAYWKNPPPYRADDIGGDRDILWQLRCFAADGWGREGYREAMTAALAALWSQFPTPADRRQLAERLNAATPSVRLIEEAADLPFDPDVAVWQSRALELCRVFEDAAEFVESAADFVAALEAKCRASLAMANEQHGDGPELDDRDDHDDDDAEGGGE